MEENVIQMKSGITINLDVSVKNIYVKRIIFAILLHVVGKIVNIKQVLLMKIQLLRVMKLKKKQELFQQILMKKAICKTQNF